MRPAIRVTDLWKEYVLGGPTHRHDTFYDLLTGVLKAPFRRLRSLRGSKNDTDLEHFWALRDLEFNAEQGEVLGVIGPNGAGKSTLLKILSRIVEPTQGRIELRGRVASLLEVGTGFHPELTGRENIYLNGAILGMTRRELTSRFDEIVSFAGVEKFLDTPVKRYSSGMYVRLAFSVASHVDTDILLVDEILAVGDSAFQQRCLGRMHDVAGSGRTVIFVSHNLGAVAQLCSRVMVVEEGRCVAIGESKAAVSGYLERIGDHSDATAIEIDPMKSVQFTRFVARDSDGVQIRAARHTDPFVLVAEYVIREWPRGSYVCVDVFDELGNRIIWSSDVLTSDDILATRLPGIYHSTIHVPQEILAPGRYEFTFSIYDPGSHIVHECRESAITLEIVDGGSLLSTLGIQRHALTSVPLRWQTTREAAFPQGTP